jgi:hypothetical protein
MKRSLLFKLLPVAVMAAIGLFVAARSPQSADATVSGISPSSFVQNAGSPTSFNFTAGASAGQIGISATGAVSTFINASCSVGGCGISGNGTSSVSITPPSGTATFTVSFTLDVSCTTSGIPITVAATQGNTTFATGITGNCVTSCVNVLLGCNCAVVVTACNCTVVVSSLCNPCSVNPTLCNPCTAYVGVVVTATNCQVPCPPGTSYGTISGPYGNTVPYVNNPYGTVYNPYGTLGYNPYGYNPYATTSPYANNCVPCTTAGLLVNCAPGTSTVSVTVPGTAACGSRVNVLATVRNSIGGIAQDGTPVTFSANAGSLSAATVNTAGGIATTSLLLPATGSGNVSVTASSGGAQGSATIAVSCAAAVAPVAPAPAPVPAPLPIISAPNAGDGGCLAKGGC